MGSLVAPLALGNFRIRCVAVNGRRTRVRGCAETHSYWPLNSPELTQLGTAHEAGQCCLGATELCPPDHPAERPEYRTEAAASGPEGGEAELGSTPRAFSPTPHE